MKDASREVNLEVQLGRLKLRNPVIGASGCCGMARELADFVDFSGVGGLVTKSITLEPRPGNPPPRVVETPAGMLNSIGLANEGCEEFVKQELPFLKELDTAVIVSIAGESADEYAELARNLEGFDAIQALEINISCPNVGKAGLIFGRDPAETHRLLAAVRKVSRRFLIVKLTPHVDELEEVARAAVDAGSDALSLTNTFIGLAVDWEQRKPKLGGVTGGLSGPAIRPLALYQLHRLAHTVNCPLIGMGGITSGEDVLEFMVTGASAVEVGTANFIDPRALQRIVEELRRTLEDAGISRVDSLVGTLEPPGASFKQLPRTSGSWCK